MPLYLSTSHAPIPCFKPTITGQQAPTFPLPSATQPFTSLSSLSTTAASIEIPMTRVSIYTSALVAFAAATVMIVTSIWLPNWVSYSVTTASGETVEKHIGLHKSCSTLTEPQCLDFPPKELCQGERYFCSLWRTVGFMASFATILCLGGLVTFVVIMSGGKYKRETGWPFVGSMMTLVAVVEFITISIVAYLYDNDDQFTIPGWNLDASFYLSTVSAIICLLGAAGLVLSAYLLPPEEGYDFLADPLDA